VGSSPTGGAHALKSPKKAFETPYRVGLRRFIVVEKKNIAHRIQQVVFGTVRNIIAGFIFERQSRGLSKRAIAYYAEKLNYFCRYLDRMGVVNIDKITPELIRKYLL